MAAARAAAAAAREAAARAHAERAAALRAAVAEQAAACMRCVLAALGVAYREWLTGSGSLGVAYRAIPAQLASCV